MNIYFFESQRDGEGNSNLDGEGKSNNGIGWGLYKIVSLKYPLCPFRLSIYITEESGDEDDDATEYEPSFNLSLG